jgi:alpha-galactosidase
VLNEEKTAPLATPRRTPLWEGPGAVVLDCSPDAPASLVGEGGALAQPLVEVLAVGHGRRSANLRTTATTVGARLRPTGVTTVDTPAQGAGARRVVVDQEDAVTGLRVRTVLELPGTSGVRAWVEVTNGGPETVVLQAVTSLALSSPLGAHGPRDVVSVEGHSDWLGESRWTTTPLNAQAGLVDLDLRIHQHQDARGVRAIDSRGSWSTGERAACGVLAAVDGTAALAWEVEHNGGWRVELAERLAPDDTAVLALTLQGPTDTHHGWSLPLAPGETFRTVPVHVVVVAGGWSDAVAELTRHRRAVRSNARARQGRTAVRSPRLVFNDYMNTLMGDPTTAKLLPLVDAAAHVGAEVFCIDAGWYDDSGDWWDSVGAWEPSSTRFPGGLGEVVHRIRFWGMVPGLWLEPEVVGVRSPVAEQLPAAAFLQRYGQRIVEHDRYLLDLRHEAARKHLDVVVDRLVDEFAVGYLKLDYNVTPGPGTDLDASSVGDGLLQHNRAVLDWLDAVQRRHPELLLENCASGGMRADAAMLTRTELQSTSDQQNPLLYPPIAAGALVAILPEQAANWAYPQPDMSPEEMTFTLCTGLSARSYLSGRLDAMTPGQHALVAEAVAVFGRTREWLTHSVPRWPLGLPGWTDTWVSSALQHDDETQVTVWFRGGPSTTCVLDLPDGVVDVAFPAAAPLLEVQDSDRLPVADVDGLVAWYLQRTPEGRVRLEVPAGTEPSARVLRVRRPRA